MGKEISIFADAKMIDALADCANSTRVMANTFFQERFFVPFTHLHDQILDVIDGGHQKVVIAAPRGIGKTSIVGLAQCAKAILFRQKKFIVYVSNSATSAELQMENLKHELISNRAVREVFGSVKFKRPDGIDESFSKKAWVSAPLTSRETGEVVEDGTLILPRGSGQQIRGILYHNARPDLFIIDDLEDTETIQNEEIRAKRKKWFFGDLLKAVSRVDKNYQYVYIDTLKHEDSLLQTLIDDDDWVSVHLEICDDNLKSTAPSFMSDEEVRREHASHKRLGLLDVFYQEFRNLPVSKEDAVFKPEYFKYYREDGTQLTLMQETYKKTKASIRSFEGTKDRISLENVFNIVIADPAKTIKLDSADSAIVCIGVDRASRKIFFRDVNAGKMKPDEFIKNIFAMVRQYGAFHFGVEVTSLHEWVSQPIENQMRVDGLMAQYHELPAKGKKIDRIKCLGPFYRMGFIYHNIACCQKLESQLESFPNSKLWDVMDAFGYLPKMLDMIDIYFDPIAMDDEDIESEYKELKDDDSLEYDLIEGI